MIALALDKLNPLKTDCPEKADCSEKTGCFEKVDSLKVGIMRIFAFEYLGSNSQVLLLE
ncbi:hypothetical protein ACSAZL_18085 [Methanosarcina sp. T3]|uniref:hypothetical protein n=1 Tax=Methanosarcina sp. T3 TaxID=3439062 RepID=UPI003F83E6FF